MCALQWVNHNLWGKEESTSEEPFIYLNNQVTQIQLLTYRAVTIYSLWYLDINQWCKSVIPPSPKLHYVLSYLLFMLLFVTFPVCHVIFIRNQFPWSSDNRNQVPCSKEVYEIGLLEETHCNLDTYTSACTIFALIDWTCWLTLWEKSAVTCSGISPFCRPVFSSR